MDDRRERALAVAVLALLGAVALGFPLADVASGGDPSALAVAPLLVSALEIAVVWGAAIWLWTQSYHGRDALLAAEWIVFFALVAASVTALAIAGQRLAGASTSEPVLLVNAVGLFGGVVGVAVAYFHTRSRRSTRTLADQTRQLRFLNRLLRHDIRNDVDVIAGYADLLRQDYPDGERLNPIGRKAAEIERLTHLAGELSESSTDLDTRTTAIASRVEAAREQVLDAFPDADVRVAGDLPGETLIAGDELLTTVFQNLLRNAVQHNDADTPVVEVRVEPLESVVRVHVADNGPGIPESVAASVCNPGATGEHSTGTGLGLYLAETVVSNCGGELWIGESDLGGAAVTVELPRRESARDDTAVTPAE